MNLSTSKPQRVPLAFQYPSVGDDRLIHELGELIASYHIEAMHWPRKRCADIMTQAWIIDSVRIRFIRGDIAFHEAEIWLDAGYTILHLHTAERTK